MNPTVSMPWNRWMKAGVWLALAALILDLAILADTVRHAPRILADDQLAACFGGCSCGGEVYRCNEPLPPERCVWFPYPGGDPDGTCTGCQPITTSGLDTYHQCQDDHLFECCDDNDCGTGCDTTCMRSTWVSRVNCNRIYVAEYCQQQLCHYRVQP